MSAPNVTPAKDARRVPTLGLSIEEAAQAIGVGWDFFHEHVAGDLRIVRVGRRKIVPVRELERWLDEHAEAVR